MVTAAKLGVVEAAVVGLGGAIFSQATLNPATYPSSRRSRLVAREALPYPSTSTLAAVAAWAATADGARAAAAERVETEAPAPTGPSAHSVAELAALAWVVWAAVDPVVTAHINYQSQQPTVAVGGKVAAPAIRVHLARTHRNLGFGTGGRFWRHGR